jgi:hypothetical protein
VKKTTYSRTLLISTNLTLVKLWTLSTVPDYIASSTGMDTGTGKGRMEAVLSKYERYIGISLERLRKRFGNSVTIANPGHRVEPGISRTRST